MKDPSEMASRHHQQHDDTLHTTHDEQRPGAAMSKPTGNDYTWGAGAATQHHAAHHQHQPLMLPPS